MKGKSNPKKKKVISGDDDDDDRISTLPDSILREILSSMEGDLKSAIQTCVLSKRWRYVWTSLPNLHFDYTQFSIPETDRYEAKMPRFTYFVNQVLSLRDNNANVCRFYFSSSGYYVDPTLVKKCICYAVRHNVRQLHVWAACAEKPFEFPRCFINYESLEVLELVYCFESMPLDKSLRLPALKTLHLNRFPDFSSNFITQTVGNCPNLETLVLDYLHLNCFNITAPQLRRLELCYDGHCIPDTYESEIVVTAPRLTSFKLKGNASPVFSTTNLPCLDDVYVDLNPSFHFDANIKQRMPLNVINMLDQLQEANSVTLSLQTLEVLAMDTDSLKSHISPFHKLKHLNLIADKLLEEDTSPTLSLPLNVITYLTRGSSCGDTLVVKFPRLCSLS